MKLPSLCSIRIHGATFQKHISLIDTYIVYKNHIQFFMNQKHPLSARLRDNDTLTNKCKYDAITFSYRKIFIREKTKLTQQ